jgi:NAD-dependent dihydropyrimidine dehydrogenase PreA subunit
MAMKVLEECTNCAACEPECPNEAIRRDEAADLFVIDAARCTECVGAHEAPQCVEVCPIDCIIPDPAQAETRDELEAKYARIHAV